MNIWDDGTLLEAIALRQDRDAFAKLFKRHEKAAYNLALNITSDRLLAEDAVREAMFSIWSSVSSFFNDKSVRGWLLRTVAQESLKCLKARQRTKPSSLWQQRTSDKPAHDKWESSAVFRRVSRELDR